MSIPMINNGNKRYEIVKNRMGRRILVVMSLFDVEKEEALEYGDFDAIYISASLPTYEMCHTIICSAHPLVIDKCHLKPFFVTSRMARLIDPMQGTIDGYASSPMDEKMTLRIEEIYGNITRLGMRPVYYGKHTAEVYLIKQIRYMLSRELRLISPVLLAGSYSGYTSQFSEIFEKMEYMTYVERRFFYQRLIELGYIRIRRFVEKIYVCPECMHSHLLFIETCPKCRNSDISEESVIHHFRCANVSPEHTYMHDGQLRCPKCRHFLRHIGVDYDRPADLYTCKTCGNHFTSPHMKVLCTKCKMSFNTSQLVPVDIHEYEFTEQGVKAFVSNEVYLVTQKRITTGYIDFKEFADDLRLTASLRPGKGQSPESVIIGRLWMGGRNGDAQRIGLESILMQYVYEEFNNYKISNDTRIIYMMQTVPADQEESRRIRTQDKLSRLAAKADSLKNEGYRPQFEVFSERPEEIDEKFIKELSILPPPIGKIS